VLITAASRRVALVLAFHRALNRGDVRGQVIATDVNPLSPAVRAANRWYMVPMADDPSYIPTLLEVASAENVGLVVPTIDDELVLFGDTRHHFEARAMRVAVSPALTSRACKDKYETCRLLRDHGISAAATWLPADVPAVPRFPLFIKPRFGRGGVGAFPVKNERELEFFLGYVPDPIVQEFLTGPEFTIDVCCDFDGRVLSIVPRERMVIRAGVIDRGRTVRDGRLIALAESIADLLPFAGAVNIQCRMVGGQPVVFEINPRFSGGIPLTIQAGADFPRMLVDLALGRTVAPAIGDFRDGLLMTNYEASVFLTPEQAKPRRASIRMGASA
jgi:carbamoyl-phosphate synthase large subunit